jgi:phosphatidylinositol alpha-mannosyltransferase
MKPVLAQVKRQWFKAVGLVIVLYVFIFHVEWDEFGYAFANVSWLFVLLAVLANFASIILKAASWKLIFDSSFNGIHARWRDLSSAIMVGFLVNAVIPARMGEVARSYVISRRQALRGHPVSRSTVFGTVVLERVFDGIVMALIVIYGVLNLDLPTWASRGAIVLVALSLVFAGLLVVLEIKRERIGHGAAAAAASGQGHDRWWQKMATRLYVALARFSEGQQVLRKPLRVAAIMLTTSSSWMSQLFAVYFSVHAFHLGEIGLLGSLLLLILINVAGALPATPGNVGIFQLATVIPLTVTYDISKTTALAFSIGLQVIEGSIGIGVGSACMLREGLKFGQVRSESLKDVRHARGQD